MSSSRHPRNVGKKACSHYMKTGECAYGRRCRFDHPPRNQKAKTQNTAAHISPGASALLRALQQCTGPHGDAVLLSKLGTLVQKHFPSYKDNGGSMKALVQELVGKGLAKRQLLADKKTWKLSLVEYPVPLRMPRQKANVSVPGEQPSQNVYTPPS